jgi:hypothetical protein
MIKYLIPVVLLSVFVVGCQQQVVGGDKDEHGCLGSAGYRWCEAKEKCLRIWEEPCQTVWKSSPLGDFAQDTRDPQQVCIQLQNENSLGECRLVEFKQSVNETECANGKSIAGCIACRFNC